MTLPVITATFWCRCEWKDRFEANCPPCMSLVHKNETVSWGSFSNTVQQNVLPRQKCAVSALSPWITLSHVQRLSSWIVTNTTEELTCLFHWIFTKLNLNSPLPDLPMSPFLILGLLFAWVLGWVVVFVSWDCSHKLPQTGQNKTTKIYSPTIIEARSPKSSCQDWFLLETRRENLFQACSLFLVAGRSPYCSLAGSCIHPISASASHHCLVCVPNPPLLSLSRAGVGFRVHAKPQRFQLKIFNFVCKDSISK